MTYRYRRTFDAGPTPVWVLIAVNFLVFIATTFVPQAIYELGLQRASLPGQPWTLLTSLFVHAGLWHILGNMLMLYWYGSFLARLTGEIRFLIIYFVGGLAGNALFLLLANPFTTAVGASGAIFALGGALAVLRPRITMFLFPIPVPMPLWVAVIVGFLLISFLPGVGWQAHLGGLATGLIAGLLIRMRERPRGRYF